MKKFLVNRANGGKSEMFVAYVSGNPVAFLIKECFIRIEDSREAYHRAGDPWDGPTRFYELKNCLIGGAKVHYNAIVAQDYPNDAQRTDAAYEELRRKIITARSDHTNPGKKVPVYLTQNVKYMKCKMKDGSGRIENPVEVLTRLDEIVSLAKEMLHHERGADFLTDFEELVHFGRFSLTKCKIG
mgnify:CR=1 FL=1